MFAGGTGGGGGAVTGDGGVFDAGHAVDAGTPDAGQTDGGAMTGDAGAVDAGTNDGGCDGLDIPTCQATPGCMPQLCEDCLTCQVTYMGCSVKGADFCSTMPCLNPSTCCDDDATCSSQGAAGVCVPPGTALCGGVCLPLGGVCGLDTDCLGHQQCVPDACCPQYTQCVADCTTGGCPQGQTCNNDPTHAQCVPTSCMGDPDCGSPSFLCTAGSCQRRTCINDAACNNALSFCIGGFCYDARGSCQIPKPGGA
jgi:hypothetical protein